MGSKKAEISIEQAKKVLIQDEQKRQEACLKEVAEILKKHGYALQVQNNIVLVKTSS
jgi:hypothetical protein